MNLTRTLRFLCAAGAAVAAFAFTATAATEKKPKEPADLIVHVEVPSLMGDSWREDEVVDVFVARVYDAFRREGYKGRIETDKSAKPAGEQRLLEFNLMRWQAGRTGGTNCTFTVSVVRDGQKPVRLGVFSSDSLRMGGGALAAAGAFEDSAEDALRDLYRRLEKENLLPGKPETKS